MFCRTDVVTRNRERIKMARKTVIAAAGKAKAMDLCLTARFMDAAEAEKSGLVWSPASSPPTSCPRNR